MGTVIYPQPVPDSQYASVLPRCPDCLKRISVISITSDKGRHQAAERCYAEQESQLLDKLGIKLISGVSSQPKGSGFSSDILWWSLGVGGEIKGSRLLLKKHLKFLILC